MIDFSVIVTLQTIDVSVESYDCFSDPFNISVCNCFSLKGDGRGGFTH